MPWPMGFTNKALAETANGVGPIFSGKVRVWGVVLATKLDFKSQYVLIDDGSAVVEQAAYQLFDPEGKPVLDRNGQPIIIPAVIGIRVYIPKNVQIPNGEYHIFEGIKGNLLLGKIMPGIWDTTIQ